MGNNNFLLPAALHYLSSMYVVCIIWASATNNFERTLDAVLKLSEPVATSAVNPNYYLIMTTPDTAANLVDDIVVAVNTGCQVHDDNTSPRNTHKASRLLMIME